ncbi:MAG: cation transporter, partial [Halobacteria archaeon]|nr:cation transporter [Halobacteria archaeon]
IGAGTDIAIESADIVLMGERLGGVMDAYEIGKSSYRKTRQNLIAAFSFNGVGVTVATTGLVHPVFAMIAMILSVTVVLTNSFAGQLIKGEGINTEFSVEAQPTEEVSDEPGSEVEPKKKPGLKTVVFDVSLHCGGCEKRVRENLSERDGIREVQADADDKRVEIGFNPHIVSSDKLKSLITELGYEVEEVQTRTIV